MLYLTKSLLIYNNFSLKLDSIINFSSCRFCKELCIKLYQKLSIKLPQSSTWSSSKTPYRALLKLHVELYRNSAQSSTEALHKALPKLYIELYQSSTQSSVSTVISTITSTINRVFNGLGLAELGLLIGLNPPAKNLSRYYLTYYDV
jgi:hypothetical protein